MLNRLNSRPLLRDFLLLAVVLALAVLLAVQALSRVSHPAEDAAMLMRYSAHLAQGHGIVWNIGEKPVDGATDFLFMVLLAVLHALGVPLETAVLGVGVIAHLLSIALVFWTVARLEPRNPWLGVFSAGLLAIGPGMAYTTAYFGTTTFAFAGALTWHLAVRLAKVEHPPRKLSMAFAAACLLTGLIRPEGVFLAALITLGLLVRREGRGGRIIFRDVALIFGGLGLVYFLWRWSYFGYPLPNPFYKKGAGLIYFNSLANSFRMLIELNQPYIWLMIATLVALLAQWLPSLRAARLTFAICPVKAHRALIVGTALAGLATMVGFLRRSQPQVGMIFGIYSEKYFLILLAGVGVTLVLFILAVMLHRWLPKHLRLPWFSSALAGDERQFALKAGFTIIPVLGFSLIWVLLSNEMNYLGRFQYPVVPIILMAAPLFYQDITKRLSLRWKRLAQWCVAVMAVGGVMLTAGNFNPPNYPDGRYDVAVYLRGYAGKGYTMATSEAGLLPFYSTWRAMDTWGLNDQWITHTGHVTDDYLDWYKPEVIVFHANLYYTAEDPENDWDWMVRGMWNYARKRGYVLAAAFGHITNNFHYYYVRPDFEDAQRIITDIRQMEYMWYKDGALAVDHAPTLP